MDMRQRVCEIKAPAKLILCGQHAVVYGEDAVALSIGLYCDALLQKRKADKQCGGIVFQLQIEKQEISVDWNLIAEFWSVWQKYGQKCSYELQKQETTSEKTHSYCTLHYKLGLFLLKSGIDWNSWRKQNVWDWFVTVKSNIPLGKGLGSSAAFNTVLSTSLFFIFDKLSHAKTDRLSFESKEMINSLAYLFECVQHGTPSGIDNFVSVHGGLIVFNRTKEPRFRLLKGAAQKLKHSLKLAIADSKIQKNTKVAVQRVREHCKSSETYVDKIKEIGKISGRVIELLSSEQELPVPEFFELVKTNHKLLSEFGLSHAEIQKLISLGESDGWVGKITGSGMGGCVLLVSEIKQTKTNSSFVQTEFDQNGLTVITFVES